MIQAIKLTKEEFDNLKPINNNVIIECVIPKEEIRPSGLIIPKDVDFFIANGVEGANKVDTSAHLDRYGLVAKVPDKIYCDTENSSNWKIPWETELEIQVGDMVWFDFYRGLHCPYIQVEGKTYRIVNYRFLIVAKRKQKGIIEPKSKNHLHSDISFSVYKSEEESITKKLSFLELDEMGVMPNYDNSNKWIMESIIPLNGFCLFEQVNLKRTIEEERILALMPNFLNPFLNIDKKQGIVKYIGSRNKKYYRPNNNRPEKFDDIEIKVGDRVVFRNETECLLENENHYKFDNIPLRYNQRADVLGIIN